MTLFECGVRWAKTVHGVLRLDLKVVRTDSINHVTQHRKKMRLDDRQMFINCLCCNVFLVCDFLAPKGTTKNVAISI